MAFLEDYTLLEELGQGAFATVYKVRHNKLGYIRAVRVLNKVISQGESDPSYQKFLEECILLLRLGNGNHPNIVHIYQPLLKDQHAVVEMDYVDGQNLYSYMDSHGSFVEIDEVMTLLKDIGGALAYCHEDIYEYCMDRDVDHLLTDPNDGSKVLIDEATRRRLIEKYQVVHNDLHPGNIMRKRNGGYILLDFGLAIEGNNVVRSSRKKNGVPEYKSPEKWRNESHISTQSDIYSFGVILYTMLAGRPPFMFDSQNQNSFEAEHQLYNAHINERPPAIYTYRKEAFEKAHPGQTYEKDYPDWLEALILKCLEKKEEDRFQSGKALMAFVEENEIKVLPPPENPGGEFENEHEYVDLGLSVKWATCNVGANFSEGFGHYFSWGELKPKTIYNLKTYQWCSYKWFLSYKLTKYTPEDSKLRLALSDDVAHANWGGSWRMPNHDEFTELRENCTWTRTTQNGVKGYKVTSKINGRSIFLPAAGYRNGSYLYCAGSDGFYWSSSLYMPFYARCVKFYSLVVVRSNCYRACGLSVRPVCP